MPPNEFGLSLFFYASHRRDVSSSTAVATPGLRDLLVDAHGSQNDVMYFINPEQQSKKVCGVRTSALNDIALLSLSYITVRLPEGGKLQIPL